MTPGATTSRGRRLTTLGLWLTALAAAAIVIWHARFNADLSAFLPAAPDTQQRLLIEQLHSGVPARSLVLAIEGGSATQRAQASLALADRLRRSGLFEQVHNGDRAAWGPVGEWVVQHRYALSPAVDAARFSVDGLREAINETLSLLGTPAGVALKPLLKRDPTGETQRLAELAAAAPGPRSDGGVWVSRDGRRALLMTSSLAAGADLDAQASTLTTIRRDFAATAAPGLTLLLSGTPKFAIDSRSQIEREVRALAIAGTLLMGSLLLLAFGSASAVAVAMLPVASGVLAGVAVVSLGFGSVHGITLAFGSTLIGEAVDYAIYYLIQTGAHRSCEPGWRAWLRQGWPTLRLGLATSVCGFAALAFSGFPGLAQLGVFSMTGLLAAAMTTRFVLPVLLPDGARGKGRRRQLASLGRRLLVAMPRWRHALTALGLASAALLAWQHDQLWRAELSSLSPVPAQALALDAGLRAELSASDNGTLIVVQAATAEAVLQATETVAERLGRLVADRRIGSFETVTRWLPSQALQQHRREALPDAATLRARLDQATAGGPLPAERLGAFVDDVQQARNDAPLTPQSIQNTPLAPLVNALLVRRDDGRWAALIPLQAAGPTLDQAAVAQALDGITGAQSLDIGAELGRLYRHYLGEAQTQTLLGALGVFLLMAVWLRSWRGLLALSLPLMLAVLLVMAGLNLLQVPLGILHLVGLLLVVAIGSNYALFFDLLRQAPTPDEDTLASLLLANLTTVLSFGLIALSAIPALSAIGRVVAPGALLALLLCAAYAPQPSIAPASGAARP